MKARKRFGQHFLTDAGVIDRIVAAMALRPADDVVEIGPGRAALTEPLYQAVERIGIVEIDRDLVPMLRAQFPNATIVNEDVLRVRLHEVLPGSLRVVGNLPYNISSPLILRLLDELDHIRDMHFMLQKEMADRLSARPGSKAWGRLSVMVAHACEVDQLFDVPPDAFDPPPKVWSSVVRLIPKRERLWLASTDAFDQVLRAVFSARRKRLGNSLKLLQEQSEWDWQRLEVTANDRAEQVSLQDFVELANQYSERLST